MDTRLIQIANHYGTDTQYKKACEEMSELIKELLKNDSRTNIVEEIADVQVMLAQIIYLMDCEKEVAVEREYKIARQIRRIEGTEWE